MALPFIQSSQTGANTVPQTWDIAGRHSVFPGIYPLSASMTSKPPRYVHPDSIIIDTSQLDPADVVEWQRAVFQEILASNPEKGPVKTTARTMWIITTFMTACVYAQRVLHPREMYSVVAILTAEFTYAFAEHDIELMNYIYGLAPKGLREVLGPLVEAFTAAWYQTEDAFDVEAHVATLEASGTV